MRLLLILGSSSALSYRSDGCKLVLDPVDGRAPGAAQHEVMRCRPGTARAPCFSWHAVLTKNYLGNAIENSIWAVAFFMVAIGLCRLLPEFEGPVRAVLVTALIGIAGYLVFLATIDVPMYLTRWRAEGADRIGRLSPLQGLRDASVRWVVTHDIAEWKDEIAWMSLYFSTAVWASLALCLCYCVQGGS